MRYEIRVVELVLLVALFSVVLSLEPRAHPALRFVAGDVRPGPVAIVVRAPVATARTQHPIVLVHGLFGFDRIELGRARQEYFRGVRAHLERLGNEVHVVRLPPLAGVRRRAESLVEQIGRVAGERVNLIAHSMGGLDARYAIAELGLSARAASLTTIGTPHRGTPLGDGVGMLLARIGVPGALDVGTRRMLAFNRSVLDADGVAYLSVVSRAESLFVRALAGGVPSDGLVPVESQAWGAVLCEVSADHWAQIGWSFGFDAVSLYERVVRELAARGF